MYTAAYPVPGVMQMPAGFKYKETLRRGRPRHEKYDAFYIRHPPMPASRWAKIFAPFDALHGFDERIKAAEEIYVERKDLDEGGGGDSLYTIEEPVLTTQMESPYS